MEKLADKGNGNYAYIDIARGGAQGAGRARLGAHAGHDRQGREDPGRVQPGAGRGVPADRLREPRAARREDFNDDTQGRRRDRRRAHASRRSTRSCRRALRSTLPGVDPLKYQKPRRRRAAAAAGELLTVKLRYKEPDGERSRLLSVAVQDRASDAAVRRTSASRPPWPGSACCCATPSTRARPAGTQVLELGEEGSGEDSEGYRAEFLELVRTAESLTGRQRVSAVR